MAYLAATLAATGAAGVAHADVVAPAKPMPLPTPLTLQDAIAIAMHRQPLQYIAKSQTQQAAAVKQEQQARYFPTIVPTYEYLQQNLAFPARTTNYNPATGQYSTLSSSSFSAGQGGVVVQEDIFDNGQREILNAQARRSLDAARDNSINVNQETILNVTQAYFNVLKDMDLVRVAELEINRAQQEVDLVQAEISAGTAARSAIFQPQADLATAQVTLSQAQTGVTVAVSGLKNTMGIMSNSQLALAPLPGAPQPETAPGPDIAARTSETAPGLPPPPPLNQAPQAAPETGVSQLPPLPKTAAPKTIDEYFQAAVSVRPDLKQQQQLVEVQKLNVKQAQLNAGVAINGTYTYSYFDNSGNEPIGSDSTVALSASFPLFDAGASRDAVKAAEAQLDATVDQYEVLRQALRTQIEQDASNRAGALDQTRLAQTAVEAAQATFDSEEAQLQQGLATVFDVTTAEVTLTQAQNQYVTALYSFYNYDAALQRDLGVNDSAPVSTF